MALLVHLLREIDAAVLAQLRAKLDPSVRLSVGQKSLPQQTDYDILVAGRPQHEDITVSPNLQALIIPFAGIPQETRALMLDFPRIAVHNLHHNAVAAAEMAISLMLAASKFIVPSDQALRRQNWWPRYGPNPTVILEGRTALILGYGAIGQPVARACRGLGMEVMATRREVDDEVLDVDIYPPEALRSLLPRANVLIVALPLTAETEGLIGAEELALLPPEAVLVNVGRGPIIEEEALYRALRDGGLHAAGLDVWYSYPKDEASRSQTHPSAYPFHGLDNVVLSPHRAGSGGSKEIERRRMAHLARLINAAAAGEEMPNRVDLDMGY